MNQKKVAPVLASKIIEVAPTVIDGVNKAIDKIVKISSETVEKYFPKTALPRNESGVAVPSSEYPHTQLGTKKGRKGSYPQSREWKKDNNGELQPSRDIDWTDHGRPDQHPDNPHQHEYEPNETGGTLKRGEGEPVEIPQKEN